MDNFINYYNNDKENYNFIKKLLVKRKIYPSNDFKNSNIFFSDDLEIYNNSHIKSLLVNHFPNINKLNFDGKLNNINYIPIDIYVLLIDNDEIFINCKSEIYEMENKLNELGKSIFKNYINIWSKEILKIYSENKNLLKGNLDSDVRETRFYEVLNFSFVIYENFESELYKISLNPEIEENVLDDMFRIVLDPIILTYIDPNHKNSWIKISNPSYLIYPYYDGKYIKGIFEKRENIYKNNKFSNSIPEHFSKHPNRFLLSNINTGYWNLLWLPFNYVEHLNGMKQNILEIPNNEGNLQIINHFPNNDIICKKVFYKDSFEKRTSTYPSYLRERYIIHKKENPEKILDIISKKFKGIWSVKTPNLNYNSNYKIFDNFIQLKEYVLEIENNKNNENGIIIEKYGESPLLYQGRKFSIQVQVLINNDKSLYISPFIFISTSSEKYTNKLTGEWDKDKIIHIPRNYTQKKSLNYGKYEEGNVISIYDISDELYERFVPQWKEIILKSYELFKNDLITTNRKYFELLAFVFDIDDNMKTYLFNIHTNIVSKWGADWADEQSKIMYNDMFKITMDPFYNLKNIGNSWIKISEPLYKYYIDMENTGPVLNLIHKRNNFIFDIPEDINVKRKWYYIYNKILDGDWNFLWFKNEVINIEGEGKKSIFTLPNPKNNIQVVNHLPNISFITNKSNLTKTLMKIPDSEKFYPKTLIFDTSDEYSKTKLIHFIDKIKPNFAIVKPPNLFSGQDIQVFDDVEKILRYIEYNEKFNKKAKGVYVIQEYINNPLLYQGRKFDIRIHVLITDDYEIYINNYRLMRLSSEKYTYKVSENWEKDKFIHITNYSVQKFSKNFGKYETNNILPLDTEINGINLFEKFLPIWSNIINLILLNIKDDLINLPKEYQDQISNDLVYFNRKKYFEILGFDFIIDEEMNTKLLEININPNFDWGNDKSVIDKIDKMVDDMFKICVDPLFGIYIGKSKNSWIKI